MLSKLDTIMLRALGIVLRMHREMHEMGFGEDEPVNGAQLLDWLNECHWGDIQITAEAWYMYPEVQLQASNRDIAEAERTQQAVDKLAALTGLREGGDDATPDL